jgi:hypothetical protein
MWNQDHLRRFFIIVNLASMSLASCSSFDGRDADKFTVADYSEAIEKGKRFKLEPRKLSGMFRQRLCVAGNRRLRPALSAIAYQARMDALKKNQG